MKTIVIATALVCLAGVGGAVAQQNPRCGPRDVVETSLLERYGEVLTDQGLSATGHLMEVWADPEDGSWTVTFTDPRGVTCLLADGQEFQSAETVGIIEPEGDPA